tara:strand:+ start:862 stop:1104 length:243 start_codon:yes stop_codon:yes gene_type:complete
MDGSIELDIEMWDNIRSMILSNDKQSPSLAFGILQNINPDSELDRSNFEKLIEDVLESETKYSPDYSKIIYVYHMLYSKN